MTLFGDIFSKTTPNNFDLERRQKSLSDKLPVKNDLSKQCLVNLYIHWFGSPAYIFHINNIL